MQEQAFIVGKSVIITCFHRVRKGYNPPIKMG